MKHASVLSLKYNIFRWKVSMQYWKFTNLSGNLFTSRCKTPTWKMSIFLSQFTRVWHCVSEPFLGSVLWVCINICESEQILFKLAPSLHISVKIFHDVCFWATVDNGDLDFIPSIYVLSDISSIAFDQWLLTVSVNQLSFRQRWENYFDNHFQK